MNRPHIRNADEQAELIPKSRNEVKSKNVSHNSLSSPVILDDSDDEVVGFLSCASSSSAPPIKRRRVILSSDEEHEEENKRPNQETETPTSTRVRNKEKMRKKTEEYEMDIDEEKVINPNEETKMKKHTANVSKKTNEISEFTHSFIDSFVSLISITCALNFESYRISIMLMRHLQIQRKTQLRKTKNWKNWKGKS